MGMELWSETWTKFVEVGPVDGSLSVCVHMSVDGCKTQKEHTELQPFPTYDTKLPKSSWKIHGISVRRAGCRLPRESTKLHFLSTIPVMNWKGWVELKSRFPAFTKVPFQSGLPQFYNVLEFTFTCVLTILHCIERFLYV